MNLMNLFKKSGQEALISDYEIVIGAVDKHISEYDGVIDEI